MIGGFLEAKFDNDGFKNIEFLGKLKIQSLPMDFCRVKYLKCFEREVDYTFSVANDSDCIFYINHILKI